MPRPTAKAWLDGLYDRYNRREYVHPDPLEFVYCYDDPIDREVVALVAGALAYGRVAQILRSVSNALGRMGTEPGRFLARATADDLSDVFADFKHRFTTGDDLARMLVGAKQAIDEHGSLGACLCACQVPGDDTLLPSLDRFVAKLNVARNGGGFSLLPAPSSGSACKRLHLLLRWMVRRDDVDPGGWEGIDPRCLLVPLDTHMHTICRRIGLTRRKQADWRTAMEITRGFAVIAPEDPVRYDFALTRLGIREEIDRAEALKTWGVG